MFRMKRVLIALGAIAATAAIAATTRAHDGRRLEILVLDNQLFVQGYLSTGVPDDGGGTVRPYYNSLHDHWHNVTSSVAIADLPGLDLFTPGPLVGHDLSLELLDAKKWVSPPVPPPPGTIPNLVPLAPGDTISIEHDSVTVDTDGLGTLTLASSIGAGGADDIDMIYSIEQNPSDVLYVLEWQLSTNAPGIAPSGTIYTLFAPDGSTPTEKLHEAALYLESYLGTPVPEPSPIALAALAAVGLVAYGWRRSKMARR